MVVQEVDVDLQQEASRVEREIIDLMGYMEPKEIARYSLVYFAVHYLSEHLKVIDDDTLDLVPCPFSSAHEDLMGILERMNGGTRGLFLFPRGHGKTTVVNFIHILWRILYRTKKNIVLTSDEQGQAKEFLRNIKTELTQNERILQDFGDLTGDRRAGGKWDELHIITANHVQVKVKTPSMAVRGMNYNCPEVVWEDGTPRRVHRMTRPDLMVFDDILNSKTVQNKDNRDKLDEWFFKDMLNALSPTGDVIVIGTLLHNDDLLSRIWKDQERTANWIKRKTPACEFDQEGNITNVLWPDYWTPRRLMKRKYEIGSLAFAQEFLLKPVDEGAQFFKQEWFRYCVDPMLSMQLQRDWNANYKLEIVPGDLMVVTSIDPAAKEKDTSDYTVVATVGYSPSKNRYYVLDVFRERCSPDMYIMEMIKQKYRWDKFLRNDGFGYMHRGFSVETYAYQATLMHWLRKYCVMYGLGKVRMHSMAEQGIDKVLRCSEMSPMVEQNRLHFPISLDQDYDKQWRVVKKYQWLEEEMNDFPHGAYDDGVDALHRAYKVLKREERKFHPGSAPAQKPGAGASIISVLSQFHQDPISEDLYDDAVA